MNSFPNRLLLKHGDVALSVCFLAVLGIIVFPLPPLLLDLFISVNISIAVLLLLVTLGAKRALDLSVFPSLLLMLTLYRISLNVATTRGILLSAEAGKLVSAFGEMVVGGNLLVGLVIFLILVIIQFIVITKGAGRVSEVAARFTLDALPGKQMAIDAELNSGAINDEAARQRRQQLGLETEFYGAMDGASKFVRGDAIAGLIITAINLLGGITVGIMNGLSAADAARTFCVLAVGDGLVSQIPALFIATASGILVTKSNSESSLGSEIGTQLFRNREPLWLGVMVLGGAALVPGMPSIPFACLSAGLGWTLYQSRSKPKIEGEETQTTRATPADSPPTNSLGDFLLADRAAIEVGAKLIGLITSQQGKTFAHRITLLRKDLSRQRGLWIPEIRVRSNLDLPLDAYRILIAGREVARGELRANQHLMILSDSPAINLPGEDTLDPAFQLKARWISSELTAQAEAHGLTVVDAASVLITHLGEILKEHGHELITRETVKEMLDHVKEFAPSIVDEVRSESIRTAVLHQVLRQLAQDGIPLADLALVLEAISNQAQFAKNPDDLTDAVRQELGRLVCDGYQIQKGTLRVLALDPRLEGKLREVVREGHLALAPGPLQTLVRRVTEHWQSGSHDGKLALLADRSLRRPLRNLLSRDLRGLGIIAYQEVPADLSIDPIGLIGVEEVFGASSGEASSQESTARTAKAAA
ncbi:MAG: FHIPEP family type III secretion protein [Planctomycetaceae bacterium]|nr:FHIPEP family type III secretion protein [Planctomycetaceae bacterium]